MQKFCLSGKFVKIIGIIVHFLDAIASLVPWSQQLGKPFKKKVLNFLKGEGGAVQLQKIQKCNRHEVYDFN